MTDDDGYGRTWEYRVFSSLNTEPDCPDTGQRHLTVHVVSWITRPPPDYPLHDDVADIEHRPATPGGVGAEALMQDAERILRACDKPAMIKAEWQSFFDHSKRSHREWTAYMQACRAWG